MKVSFKIVSGRLVPAILLLVLVGGVKGQYPTSCATIGSRANSNGQANSCPNFSGTGTGMASNFSGTSYATVPAPSKTGNLEFDYAGANPSLTPYAVTRVWLTSGTTAIQTVQFGPASPPVVVGGNTAVSYCFYGANLASVGTLSFELTNPQTGVVWGICSFDASCNSNCALVANPAALPVVYMDFTVKAAANAVQLDWTTAQEENNRGFTIERSAGDSLFSAIGFVATTNTNGNSQLPTRYGFTDKALPGAAEAWYRLRQEDMDGKLNYSSIRVVHLTPGGEVKINAAGNALKISIPSSGVTKTYGIEVYDPQGRLLQRKQVTGGSEYTIAGLAVDAVYYVSVKDGAGRKVAVRSVYIK